jgi:molybdopterin biosynthesis enzyme MoaB
LIIFTGGTGLSPQMLHRCDQPLIERVPLRDERLKLRPPANSLAMLSRGIAGFAGDALLITLPGSPRGAEESMDAVFPYILHVFRVREGVRHN